MTRHDARSRTANLLTNLRESVLPLLTKVRLTLRNRWIATVLGRGCCGHPGEPGC